MQLIDKFELYHVWEFDFAATEQPPEPLSVSRKVRSSVYLEKVVAFHQSSLTVRPCNRCLMCSVNIVFWAFLELIQAVLSTRQLWAGVAGAGTKGVSLVQNFVENVLQIYFHTCQAFIWLIILVLKAWQVSGISQFILQDACHGYL